MDLAVAFEGDDAVADAVEKVAVVTDEQDDAGEVEEGFFEDAEGLEVKVVGGFVEHDDIAAATEDFGEEEATALAAGHDADLLGDAVVAEEETF